MNLLVLGANSDLAFALAKQFAEAENADLWLASRDVARLEAKARDINLRYGVKTQACFFDAETPEAHAEFYAQLDPKPDAVIVAFGLLGDQAAAQKDFGAARRVFEANCLGAISILEIIAADFERRGHGGIIGISSVAGERGRQSNYMYGAAKGALTIYLSGLRNRLARRGVFVMTVLPGFMHTKMTEGMALPEKLTALPEEAAVDIHRAYRNRRDVVYTRWFWRWIMLVIRLIPETMFKRLRL
ncbi:MAG: SDR family oxidoreductase [Thermodesulfobacteriota bacterium]